MLHPLHTPPPTDAESEAHRQAYNAAFHELDLNWHWDASTFAGVQRYGRAGVRSWLETEQAHLLRAYSAEFLVDLIETTKARYHAAMARAAAFAPSHESAVPGRRLAA